MRRSFDPRASQRENLEHNDIAKRLVDDTESSS
jgi:hypothetical protein